MKAIILAAGSGKRTGLPFNKVLLTYNNISFLEWNILKLRESGIKDIAVVVGKKSLGELIEICDNYPGVSIFYQSIPLGPAHGLIVAKEWLNDDFVVVMGDNYFSNNFSVYIEKFNKDNKNCAFTYKIFPKEIAQKYSIYDLESKVLLEKPRNMGIIKKHANICYCGLMMFKKNSSFKLDNLFKSERGEYEITDFFNLCSPGTSYELTGTWYDVGDLKMYAKLIQGE